MLHLFRSAGPSQSCQKKPRRILSARPVMMLSSVVMPLNSATFWKVRAMPLRAPPRGAASARAGLPLNVIWPLLRMIEAVDAVEHRRLAGAVRADDGADLAFADVERDAGERSDPAEGERDIIDRRAAARQPRCPARWGLSCPPPRYVIAGLDPAIHPLRPTRSAGFEQKMDARVKPRMTGTPLSGLLQRRHGRGLTSRIFRRAETSPCVRPRTSPRSQCPPRFAPE